MGDLIIKPASSGSLKIQDQAGTDFITTGTSSGLTLGSGVTNNAGVASGTIGSGVIFPAGGTGNPISIAVIADEQAESLASQSLTTSFTTRELNTKISDPDGIVSISSNQFTLGAGTYLITWSCPAYKVNRHVTQLYDVTSTTDLAQGQTAFSGAATDEQQSSTGAYVHTISSNNVYEIRHACQTARNNDGGGIEAASNTGSISKNIFTIVTIYKLK